MKIKTLLSAAILAIAMTGCTSDEVVLTPETADTPISFNAITNNITRASHSFCSNDMPESFKVWAFDAANFSCYFYPGYNGGTEYSGDEVKYTENIWKSTVDRYWPKYGYLSFIAYSDDQGTFKATYSESGDTFEAKFVDYKVTESTENQGDLIFAVTTNQNESSNGGKVNLNFLHALSQICFEAENRDISSEFSITKIELQNIKNQGTFQITTSPNFLPGTEKGYSSHSGDDEWVDYSTRWISNEETSTYSVELTNVILDKATLENGGIINNAFINISNPKGNHPVDANDTDSDDDKAYAQRKSRALNLIPQLNYNNEVGLEGGVNIVVSFSANGGNVTSMTLPVNIQWKAGKRYIYKLIFDHGGEIKYEFNVADFVDEDTQNV